MCGHRLMVDSGQIGQLVVCPKCEQSLEVTASKYDPPKTPEPQPSVQQNPEQSPGKAKAKPGKKRRRRPVAAADTASQESQPAARKQPARKNEAPAKTDLMDVQFSEDQLESTFSGSEATRCKKCGNPAPYGRCSACRYVEPRFKKMHQPLGEIKMQLAGMQLWFCKTLSEGISITVLATISHICAAIPLVMLLLLSILQFRNGGYAVGGMLLLMALVAGLLYLNLVYKGYQFVRNPRTKIGLFQQPFWFLVLVMARLGKWEHYDNRLKDRRVIKISDRGFTDQQLSNVSGIRNVQVLDLENTQFTDRGVALLYRLEHLQCVVLVGTNVTHDAVVRLQQTFPKLWIWY